MFCYNLHPAQPEEDWPPLIAWFLSRFLPRFWPFLGVFPSHRASTPALLAVWGFRLGFCTALCDISWCKKDFIKIFDWFDCQVKVQCCQKPLKKLSSFEQVWASDIRIVAISNTLRDFTNCPMEGQQVMNSAISGKNNMFVKHKSKCTAVKRWSKPQDKIQSFKLDLNQLPNDCYNYHLQSYALPTELSKVDKYLQKPWPRW